MAGSAITVGDYVTVVDSGAGAAGNAGQPGAKKDRGGACVCVFACV
jgi:hypothetical protein